MVLCAQVIDGTGGCNADVILSNGFLYFTTVSVQATFDFPDFEHAAGLLTLFSPDHYTRISF